MATFEHYALVIPTGFYQLSFVHEAVGVPDDLIVTIGFGGAGYTLTQADLNDIRDNYALNIVQSYSSNISLQKVYARDAGGVVLEHIGVSTGGSASALGPVSNAILVEKRSGLSGRRNRGRMYLPAALEAEVAWDGRINSTYQTLWQGNMDDFLTFLQGVDALAEPVILHSKGWDGNTEPPDPGNAPAPTVITSFSVKNLIGTQRRRIR